MEQNFLNNQKSLLEVQIRECYGRVAYSHKIHEKCADILSKRNSRIKLWQIILSAITTGSLVVTIFGNNKSAYGFSSAALLSAKPVF
ncbi:MAG: SLATT domain-containing protein, partial [Bacillota bacterium]